MKPHKTSKNATLKHIKNVQFKITNCINELNSRAMNHDRSKLEEPELKIFDKYTPKLKMSTYNSKEYKKALEEMKPALLHHYANNRHHPEHFIKYVCDLCFKEYKTDPIKNCDQCGNGMFKEEVDINQMNLIDIVEMFCDWIAATERHFDGNIYTSLIVNQDRFKISDQLNDIFKNTALDIFNKEPIEEAESVKNNK